MGTPEELMAPLGGDGLRSRPMGLVARGHPVTLPAGLPTLRVWQLQTCPLGATCFVSILVLAGPATMGPTQPPPHHLRAPPPAPACSTLDCSSAMRITLYFVQKGLGVLAVFIFCQAYRASGCCVCMCVCVCACAHMHMCFHLFFHCTRYLLSARYVPGTVAEFL